MRTTLALKYLSKNYCLARERQVFGHTSGVHSRFEISLLGLGVNSVEAESAKNIESNVEINHCEL